VEKAGVYEPGPVEISKVLAAVARQFSDVAGRKITIRLDACSCTVIANELLKDVFQNLVGNAIKHSTGPLTINILAEKIGECGGDAFCRVTVEDNGPGIPDADKEKLFDRLSLEKPPAAGRGFGLCLTKLLIDDFGGRLHVEDRVSGDSTKGAKFVVMLPVAKKESDVPDRVPE
jgi:Signal transduction histidine kinase